jgi:3-methylcrotonyl-CoA carboxylase alpha subunit
VHPGYGFLSENKLFAEACRANDIVFIGPKVQSLEDMGSKSRAKEIMEAAGVPLIRGYHGRDQTPSLLREKAAEIGFPMMIKATMGGGGRGMLLIHSLDDFDKGLDSVRRTADELYRDDTVILEKFITDPRHIEVQVFGDSFGNHVHFYERDCSVQRRHQKVVEESPSFLDEESRARLCQEAINAAKAVDYVGAGTVEFIYDAIEREFYFMEMNTRL